MQSGIFSARIISYAAGALMPPAGAASVRARARNWRNAPMNRGCNFVKYTSIGLRGGSGGRLESLGAGCKFFEGGNRLLKLLDGMETVIRKTIDNQGRQIRFNFINRNESINSANVKMVIERIHPQVRILVSQRRQNIAHPLAIFASIFG